MAKLILTVGLPRSGKSTWARQQGLPIVSRDAIRLAVHGNEFIAQAEDFITYLETTMAKSLLLAGNETVIIDATHTTHERRQRWYDIFKHDDTEIVTKVFPIHKDVCISRAKADGKENLIPVIERMWAGRDLPLSREHFAEDDLPV